MRDLFGMFVSLLGLWLFTVGFRISKDDGKKALAKGMEAFLATPHK